MKDEGKNRFYHFRKELSQEAFTGFFDFYYTRLLRFASAVTKSELLAEEIVLDVFVRLWRQRFSLASIKNIETYLFISVRNTSLNMLRKEKKFHFDMLEDAHIQMADYKGTADNDLIEEEMLAALNEAVGELPPKCKIIFKLMREDGLSRKEVAQALNISAKTVDNQIAIAVKKIAERLNIDLSIPENSRKLVSFLLSL